MPMLIPDRKRRAATIIASIRPRELGDQSEESQMESNDERYSEDTRMAVFAMAEKLIRQIQEKDVEGLAQTLRDLHDMHHIEPTPEQVEADKENLGLE